MLMLIGQAKNKSILPQKLLSSTFLLTTSSKASCTTSAHLSPGVITKGDILVSLAEVAGGGTVEGDGEDLGQSSNFLMFWLELISEEIFLE